MIEYYRRDGTPIGDTDAYIAYRDNVDQDDKRVAEDTVGDYWVSTVFLGLNHQWDPGEPPLIFETMVFPNEQNSDQLGEEWYMERYSTEAEAVVGHDQIVAKIRDGELP